MTVADVRALPAAVPLVEAAKALGLGRTVAYALARSGQWPTPLLRLGAQWRVPRAALLRLLELEDEPS